MQTWQEIYRQNVQSHQINTKSILSNHYTTPVKSENVKLESTINFVKAMEKCLDTKPAEILKKKSLGSNFAKTYLRVMQSFLTFRSFSGACKVAK